jgi:hypothetical protein
MGVADNTLLWFDAVGYWFIGYWFIRYCYRPAGRKLKVRQVLY